MSKTNSEPLVPLHQAMKQAQSLEDIEQLAQQVVALAWGMANDLRSAKAKEAGKPMPPPEDYEVFCHRALGLICEGSTRQPGLH